MRKSSVLGLIFLTLFFCDEKKHVNPVSALALDHNSIQMKIGDSWLYRQTFINTGLTNPKLLPDTVVGYSFFLATKDTTIDLRKYIIIEGRDYDVGKDSVQIFKKKVGINFTDSTVTLYEFRTGMESNGYLSGVLKLAVTPTLLTRNNFGTLMLKRIALARLFSAIGFDTSVFWDFVTPIKYPLVKDSIYVYRDSGNLFEHMKVRRKFLGIEFVQVPAGLFEAYKFEWLTKEYLSAADSIFYCDWIGEQGLIKRYAYFPKNIIASDSLGIPVDSCTTFQTYELIGKNDINPDTLIPWGK